MRKLTSLILTLTLLFLANPSLALSPEKHLVDPKLEKRAIQIFKEVKCLVCQGQSIHGSNTEFSRNLRKIIREKISKEGLANQEVKNHLENEFGKQILFSSQIKSFNELLLYILPLILSLLFLGMFLIRNKKN